MFDPNQTTMVKATPETIHFLKRQQRYSTLSGDRTTFFHTLEDATGHYNSLDVREGKAELREMAKVPVFLIKELNECRHEAERWHVFLTNNVHHNYATRIETKYSAEGKEVRVPGITYTLHFGRFEMVDVGDLIQLPNAYQTCDN